MKINKKYAWLALAAVILTSCENESISFPDFEYQTVYFANPYPVRTLELGEDLFVDTSLDNEHKVEIKATIGGVYANKKNVLIDFVVDESLCDNLYFEGTDTRVLPLPASYYKLASNVLTIKSGNPMGGVVVEFTDAFFQDPKSLSRNYVIPLVMTNVLGADSILRGEAVVDSPDRCNSSNWSIAPRDYVLYAMKYVNPWHGNYLRRGVDSYTKDGVAGTNVRHQEYVERDPVIKLSTTSYSGVELPVVYTNKGGINLPVTTIVNFDGDNCTISPKATSIQVNSEVRVYNITASGSGKFVKRGEKNSIGGKDRDAIYLDYEVAFDVETRPAGGAAVYETQRYSTKDTLVVRDRAVAPEYFAVERK